MDRSWVRGAFVAFVVLVTGWHLVAVTAASLPPNRYSEAVEPTTGYLKPYFGQNWRLFAPNPVGEDRTVKFQGSFRGPSGAVEQTEWVDWTSVELDVVRHRVVGGRAGYVTNKLIEALSGTSRRLTSAERDLTTEGDAGEPQSLDDLSSSLLDAGAPAVIAGSFVRHEQAVAILATQAVLARNPDLELVGVRYSITIHAVVPFDRRGDESARPQPTVRLSGWRPADRGTAAGRASVADFDARHR